MLQRVKVTKLKELPDALHPNNLEEGFVISGDMVEMPTIGKRFYLFGTQKGTWSTSGVQEIIDYSTFRTYSSIYQITKNNKPFTL